MKQSKLFGKTQKKDKEFGSVNEEYLIRGGFVHKVMAGAYTFMPLGLRVLNKIERIVREEMDKIGTEMLMTSLAPKEIWEQTGRLDSIDVLMKTIGANEISRRKSTNEYVLNCTHEDNITPIAQKFHTSYKDLPVAAYQIQTKFRNEARAKSGLLRGREFRMKDLYSFHTSEEDLLDYYHNQAKPAYIKVFERLGIGEYTVVALASGGDFTKEFSHEFQTKCDAGEDLIFYSKKLDTYFNKEVTPSKAPAVKYDKEMKEMEEVYGEHITGMEALVEFLKVPAERCMKTLIYEADDRVVAVGIRGNYDIDEIKLKKVLGCQKLELASEETLKKVTSAEVGYAGIVGLPDNVEVIVDESMENAINFECGGNKTNYHNINVNWDRDVKKPAKFYDVKVAQEGDIHPETGEVYEVFKAAEVGNIFPLNTKFSDAIGYKFVDKDGKEKPVYMGSYGIGCSRLVGVIVERFHDEKGIIWPIQVAPFHVHLISLGKEEETNKEAERIYTELQARGIEVLWDDRDVSAGVKFGDSDLFGIPFRVVVSKKTMEKNGVEIKMRNEENSEIKTLDEVIELVNQAKG